MTDQDAKTLQGIFDLHDQISERDATILEQAAERLHRRSAGTTRADTQRTGRLHQRQDRTLERDTMTGYRAMPNDVVEMSVRLESSAIRIQEAVREFAASRVPEIDAAIAKKFAETEIERDISQMIEREVDNAVRYEVRRLIQEQVAAAVIQMTPQIAEAATKIVGENSNPE